MNNNIPDIFKYQLNGKTAQENYIDYKKKQQNKFNIEADLKKQLSKELEIFLSQEISRLLETLKI